MDNLLTTRVAKNTVAQLCSNIKRLVSEIKMYSLWRTDDIYRNTARPISPVVNTTYYAKINYKKALFFITGSDVIFLLEQMILELKLVQLNFM